MLRIFKKKAAPVPFGGGPDELAELAGARAGNLFSAHGLSCSEAVLIVLDRGFGGGLGLEAAMGLGSGFGGGVGGSGCLCGGLSGAVMGLGLFLGPGRWERHDKKGFRRLVAGLHDRFRERSGSTCCRQLIADFRGKRTERKHFCGDLTGWSAREAARAFSGIPNRSISRLNRWLPTPGTLFKENQGVSLFIVRHCRVLPCMKRKHLIEIGFAEF
jgi:C_GCAxxG_C_C family probable redox protein